MWSLYITTRKVMAGFCLKIKLILRHQVKMHLKFLQRLFRKNQWEVLFCVTFTMTRIYVAQKTITTGLTVIPKT